MNRFFSSMWEKSCYINLGGYVPLDFNEIKEKTVQEEALSSQENKSSINKVFNKYKQLNFKKMLYIFNRLFTYYICFLYCYYIFQLWSSAYSRSTYAYVPIPRMIIGFQDIFFGDLMDTTLFMTSILIIVVFAVAVYLCYSSYLVPGSFLAVCIMYIVSYILSNTDIYTYYYRETTEFTHIKGDCCVLLVITIIHYVVMLVLIPYSNRVTKWE